EPGKDRCRSQHVAQVPDRCCAPNVPLGIQERIDSRRHWRVRFALRSTERSRRPSAYRSQSSSIPPSAWLSRLVRAESNPEDRKSQRRLRRIPPSYSLYGFLLLAVRDDDISA